MVYFMEESHDDKFSSPHLSKRKVGSDYSQVKTKRVGRLLKHVESRMTSFNDLPPELLCNIFAWLPLISLLRIRCTCKLWYKLMSDPRVIATQFSRQRRTTVGHLVMTTTEVYYVEKVGTKLCCLGPTPRTQRKESISYAHSSGGLVVSRAYSSSPNLYYYYVVENPITRERFEIPDEELGCLSWGFGYSPSTNEYKLVRIACNPNTVSVFSLGSGSGHWRRTGNTPFSPGNGILPVECEGSIFWKVDQDEKAISMNRIVMSFDVASECFRSWKGPQVGEYLIRHSLHVVKMGKSVGCVYGTWTNELQIWVLRDMTKDVWVKEHNILSRISPPLVFDFRICSGTWMDNDVFFGRDDEFPISYYRHLYVRDGDRGSFEAVKCPLRATCLRAVPHIGSLLSPFNLLGEQLNNTSPVWFQS